MSLKTKIVFAKARMIIFFQDIYEEAKKLALAVVIVEFMLVGAYAYLEHTNYFDRFTPNTIYINSVRADIEKPQEKQASTIAPKASNRVETLASIIYLRESTNGLNNYSQCKKKGLINGIGYGIPGDGTYQCFKSHEEEMETLRGWLQRKIDKGMDDTSMLCLYSGSNYKECKK